MGVYVEHHFRAVPGKRLPRGVWCKCAKHVTGRGALGYAICTGTGRVGAVGNFSVYSGSSTPLIRIWISSVHISPSRLRPLAFVQRAVLFGNRLLLVERERGVFRKLHFVARLRYCYSLPGSDLL